MVFVLTTTVTSAIDGEHSACHCVGSKEAACNKSEACYRRVVWQLSALLAVGIKLATSTRSKICWGISIWEEWAGWGWIC